MAMKPLENTYAGGDDISSFMATVGERGGIACFTNAAAFGTGMDEPDNVVAYAAGPSGARPAGLLTQTVENTDPTVTPRNYQDPDLRRVNSKVHLVKKGEFTTNMVDPAVLSAVEAGETAYLAASGLVSNAQATGAPVVGQFKSYADSEGYVRLSVDVA